MRILFFILLLSVRAYGQPSYFYDTEERQNHVRLIWGKDVAANGTGSAGYDIQYKRCASCTWLTPTQAAPPSAGTDVTLYFTGDTTAVAYNIPSNSTRWFRIRTITGGGPTYSAWLNSETGSEIATTKPGPLIVRTGLFPPRQQGHTQDSYTYTAPNYSAEITNEFGNDVNSVTSRASVDDLANTWGYPTNPNYHLQADSTIRIYFSRPEQGDGYDFNPSTWASSTTEGIDRIVNPGPNDTLISYKAGGSGSYNQLIETRDGTATTIKTFTGYRNDYAAMIPTAETKMSYDGRYIALEVYATGETKPTCLVYDIHNDVIVSAVSPNLSLGGGWFGVSPSGRWVIWITSPSSPDGRNLYIRNNDATQSDSGLGNLWPSVGSVGHADMTVTVQGHDAIIGRDANTSKTVLIPIEGPKAGTLINLHPVTDVAMELSHTGGDSPLNPGWASVDHKNGDGTSTPTGNALYSFHKVWSVHLNEYVEDLNIDAYVRYYARQMTNGTFTTSDNHVYAHLSPDGTYMLYNQDLPATNNSFVAATAWRAQRTAAIGDEIAYNDGTSDVTAPTITAGPTESELTGTSVKIDWSLSEGGTGQIEYGLTTGYGSTTTIETSYLTRHIQVISGLSPGTTYHYRVIGQDPSSNAYTGTDGTFTTTAAAPVVWGVIGSAATTTDGGKVVKQD